MSTESDRQVLNSILNPNLPLGEGVFDPEQEGADVVEENAQVVPQEVKDVELEGMMTAENGNIDGAIQIFTQIIEENKNYASAYNNRAQAYRLKADTNRALGDLEAALRLSGGKGKVAARAFCQRGMINRKFGHDDSAIEDFKAAADLGSAFAKSMLVEMNPYAAMCNAMLKNVFEAMATGSQPQMAMPNVMDSKKSG
eukprot:TRINITY_DN8803_c0_g1_i1.p1 TRINITY_DN8803_c0_g1~~TRINITY_DN8803_c0_g1_i1.p1  ORF type:complete len:198 (-),score=52.48 TRINITY_DN8803_c0_g1_i1:70-663(-)